MSFSYTQNQWKLVLLPRHTMIFDDRQIFLFWYVKWSDAINLSSYVKMKHLKTWSSAWLLPLTCKYGVIIFIIILIIIHIVVFIFIHAGQIFVVRLIWHVLLIVLVVNDHRWHFSSVQGYALATAVQCRATGRKGRCVCWFWTKSEY